MTITPTNILLEQLILEETEALAWDDKLFKIRSIIKTTSEIGAATRIHYSLPENYLIKRKRKVQIALSVLAAGIITTIYGYILLTKFSTGGLILSTVLLTLIYYALYNNLIKKNINFEIKLSKRGIEIDDNSYQWTEIQETFLVYRHTEKSIYFIIGMKNGFLDRYDITNLLEFNLNERTFSALIEEYRHH